MNPGVTIFLRAGDNLAASLTCLESLAGHNSYKPLEVLLWAEAPQDAVALVRPLLPRLFVRVLPGSTSDCARLTQHVRYDRLLVLDPTVCFQGDVIGEWLQCEYGFAYGILLCRKGQFKSLGKLPLNLPLDQLSNVLNQPSSPAPKTIPSRKLLFERLSFLPVNEHPAVNDRSPPELIKTNLHIFEPNSTPSSAMAFFNDCYSVIKPLVDNTDEASRSEKNCARKFLEYKLEIINADLKNYSFGEL